MIICFAWLLTFLWRVLLKRGEEMRKKGYSSGFTIVELLLAIVLLGVLVTVVYSTFVESVNAGKTAVRVSTRYASAGRVLEIMGRELESAFLSASYRGTNPEPVTVFLGERDTLFGEEADRITFFTLALDFLITGAGDSNISEMGEVSYYLQADYETEKLSLWKRVDYLPDREHYHGGYRVKILDDVKALTFRYFDGKEWKDWWDSTESGELPQAVEIYLSVWNRESASQKEAGYFTLHKIVILRMSSRSVQAQEAQR